MLAFKKKKSKITALKKTHETEKNKKERIWNQYYENRNNTQGRSRSISLEEREEEREEADSVW